MISFQVTGKSGKPPDVDILIDDLGGLVRSASSRWAWSTDSRENQARLKGGFKSTDGRALHS